MKIPQVFQVGEQTKVNILRALQQQPKYVSE